MTIKIFIAFSTVLWFANILRINRATKNGGGVLDLLAIVISNLMFLIGLVTLWNH